MKLTKEEREEIRRGASEASEGWRVLRIYECLDTIDALETVLEKIMAGLDCKCADGACLHRVVKQSIRALITTNQAAVPPNKAKK